MQYWIKCFYSSLLTEGSRGSGVAGMASGVAGMASGVAGMDSDLARASLATTSLMHETSRRVGVGLVPTLPYPDGKVRRQREQHY